MDNPLTENDFDIINEVVCQPDRRGIYVLSLAARIESLVIPFKDLNVPTLLAQINSLMKIQEVLRSSAPSPYYQNQIEDQIKRMIMRRRSLLMEAITGLDADEDGKSTIKP